MAKILKERDIRVLQRKGQIDATALKKVKTLPKKPDPLEELLNHVKSVVGTSENIMEANNKLMAYMLDKIVDIKQPDVKVVNQSPDVNVVNQSPDVKVVNQSPGNWEFTVQRDSRGFIKKVRAKAGV